MSDVLVVAETRRGELREVSLELVGAAPRSRRAAGGRLAVAVIDHEPERFAPASSADGVDEVLLVGDADASISRPMSPSARSRQLIESEQPALVLLGLTIDSLGFAPAVAARRRLGFASDVTRCRGTTGRCRGAAPTETSCWPSSSSRVRSARC